MKRIQHKTCVLLLIDWQERLFPAMPEEIRERHLRNAERLKWLAGALEIPIVVTEQYSKGLGPTLSLLQPVNAMEKTVFSAFGVIQGVLKKHPDRENIILSGMETHICVAQTAMDLLEEGYKPILVNDACLSRRKLDWRTAIQRLQKEDICITTTEALLFEFIRGKEHIHFKALSKRIRNQ